MKTITIQVPDGCEVQIVKKEENKKKKFEKGDIIVSQVGLIAIYEKEEKALFVENKHRVYYSTLYSPNLHKFVEINTINFGIGYTEDCRLANDAEKEILIKALMAVVGDKKKDANQVLKDVFNIVPTIKTYQDLIDNKIEINGYIITSAARLEEYSTVCDEGEKDVAASVKVAKSMLAMAMISQLMPYYGGEITDEEWKEKSCTTKYTIDRIKGNIAKESWDTRYNFLAFHTPEQRNEFLKYNEQLVKDYLMIE